MGKHRNRSLLGCVNLDTLNLALTSTFDKGGITSGREGWQQLTTVAKRDQAVRSPCPEFRHRPGREVQRAPRSQGRRGHPRGVPSRREAVPRVHLSQRSPIACKPPSGSSFAPRRIQPLRSFGTSRCSPFASALFAARSSFAFAPPQGWAAHLASLDSRGVACYRPA